MKFNTVNLENQLDLALKNMPIEDLVEVINRSLSGYKENCNKHAMCPCCGSVMQETPSKRLSAHEFACPACNHAYLYYQGRCRAVNKKITSGGRIEKVSIRCYDASGLERFIEMSGGFESVSKIEMKSKDEFSLLIPVPNYSVDGDCSSGPGIFVNSTLRSKKEIEEVKIYGFDNFFPMLGNYP